MRPVRSDPVATNVMPVIPCVPATVVPRHPTSPHTPLSSSPCSFSWQLIMEVFAVTTAVKLLFIPSYYSTDFDVHRNWMAITWSLPCNRWYLEDTSKWTLDYPPLFAWFEWLLAAVASQVLEAPALKIQKEPYSSWSLTVFQRSSVVASDVVLCLGLVAAIRSSTLLERTGSQQKLEALVVALLLHPGLLIVDHVHFQYNGFLIGVFLLSIAALQSVGAVVGNRPLSSALLCQCTHSHTHSDTHTHTHTKA